MWLKPKMFLFCFTKILNQALYMTHTFDSEVSLHSWLLWPTVRRHTALCFLLTFSGLQLYYDVFKCTPILASFADDAAAHSGFIWLKPAPNKLS